MGQEHRRCCDDYIDKFHDSAPFLGRFPSQIQRTSIAHAAQYFLGEILGAGDTADLYHGLTQAAISKEIFINWDTRAPGLMWRFPGDKHSTTQARIKQFGGNQAGKYIQFVTFR